MITRVLSSGTSLQHLSILELSTSHSSAMPLDREIPGYIYDKEKNKYFRIQPPSSSNAVHSSHDAKRVKLSNEREEAEKVALRKQHGRIKRSLVLETPSMGGLLSRSEGRTSLDVSQIFVSGQMLEGYIKRPFLDNKAVFAIDHRPDRGGQRPDIWTATFEGSSMLPVQLDKEETKYTTSKLIRREPYGRHIKVVDATIHQNRGNGQATSLSINDSVRQVAMTWLADGAVHDGIRICYLGGSRWNPDQMPQIVLDPLHITHRELQLERDILSSVAAHPSSSLRFVFGTSSGILTLNKTANQLEVLKQAGRTREEAKLKHILALEFLDQNVLLSGSRRGVLNLIDLRDPRFGNSATTIGHPSSITQIKRLDEHRILVAGLNTALWPMCQYDLRFNKQDAFKSYVLSKAPKPRGKMQTRPILTYPEYHNTADLRIGLDIDLEAGVVAAAQANDDHYHYPIQFFSLKGGQKLRCRAIEKSFGPPLPRLLPVRCMRFERDVEGRAKSLWMSEITGLSRFVWGEDKDA